MYCPKPKQESRSSVNACMPIPKAKVKLSLRVRKRRFTQSISPPRWVFAAAVLLIGFMLLLVGLSDREGIVRPPGLGGYLGIAAVLGIAAGVVYFDPGSLAAAKERVRVFISRNLSRAKRSSHHLGSGKGSGR